MGVLGIFGSSSQYELDWDGFLVMRRISISFLFVCLCVWCAIRGSVVGVTSYLCLRRVFHGVAYLVMTEQPLSYGTALVVRGSTLRTLAFWTPCDGFARLEFLVWTVCDIDEEMRWVHVVVVWIGRYGITCSRVT